MKKDNSLQNLLNQVAGVTTGESVVPTLPPRKPKKFTPKTLQRLLDLFRLEEQAYQTMQRAKESRERLRDKIRQITAKWGIPLVERPDDRVLYLHPYKAQIEVVTEAGGIDAEPVIEWAERHQPDLILHQVDLGFLKTALAKEKGSPQAIKKFEEALSLVAKLAASVEGSSEKRLDLSKYEEAKRLDLIPKEVLSRAEAPLKRFERLAAIKKFTGKHRCKGCGAKKPKGQNSKYTFPKCKTTE